jgi:peptidyl-prolyl cis-trans isomerase A (cyclophilin A)
MKHRFLAAALLAALAAPAFAQTAAPATTQAPAPKEDLVPVAIDTDLGRIVVALDRGRAPITTANFLRYVDTHRFDGQNFYRAMLMPVANGADGGLIQGGITSDARKLFPPIAHEPTSQTGLRHVDGALSMARFDPGTADGDFFIIVGNLPGFDAGRAAPGDPGFAVFGRVIEGMAGAGVPFISRFGCLRWRTGSAGSRAC